MKESIGSSRRTQEYSALLLEASFGSTRGAQEYSGFRIDMSIVSCLGTQDCSVDEVSSCLNQTLGHAMVYPRMEVEWFPGS